ncbi:hypothetical protein [Scytonema sp. PCC 10023]|uniref:hypothetical protein n=1 Tax=Scytonema sp. PCC 10023 TaxID=1680591 RepID=UPI0039C6A507
MDVTVLTSFLAPFLPFLVKSSEAAAKEAGKQFGSDAWIRAKSIWTKLLPKMQAKEAAREAFEDLAEEPQNETLKTIFRLQLEKLLKTDEALAKTISQLIDEDSESVANVIRISQTVSGEKNVTIGQQTGGNFTLNN